MKELSFKVLIRFGAYFVVFLALLLFAVLVFKSSATFKSFGIGFIFDSVWDVNKGHFGGAAAIYATLLSTALAMIFALPVALGVGVFLTHILAKKFREFFSICIELLAAIPSIIYGMWGFLYFVPLVGSIFGGSGVGLLASAGVLAIMILPLIACVSKDAINAVPKSVVESAYALGATRAQVLCQVVLPHAKTGILAGAILALARALGETMAVVFLMGGVLKVQPSLVEPASSIALTIALQFGEAMTNREHESALFALALILFVISALCSSGVRYVFK